MHTHTHTLALNVICRHNKHEYMLKSNCYHRRSFGISHIIRTVAS